MPSADLSPLIRKLESIGELSDLDRKSVADLPLRMAALASDEDAVREGAIPSECCLLIDGFMHRYKLLPDGKRQIIAFHTFGDVPDLQSLFLRAMDHSVAATTASTVAYIPHKSLRELMRMAPATVELFWRDTLVDAAIFREWMVNLGRRSAYERIAHLLCELFVRLKAVGMTTDYACRLPMTQATLSDAVGLSTVHVNRTLRELREDGLVELQGSRLTIADWNRLQEAGLFDPAYLNLRDPAMA